MKPSSLFSYKSLLIISLILILWGTSFVFLKTKNIWKNKQQNIVKNQVQPLEDISDYLNNTENNRDPDFAVAKKYLEDGDIKGAIPLWEKVVKKNENVWDNTNTSTTTSKVNSKIVLAQTYLQYGNYYYKEKEYADKAIKTITENSEDDYGAQGMYFVGYAYEITKRYEDALTWYEKGLKVSSNTDKLNAIFKNQIGHVHDLMGDIEKANEYYVSCERLWLDIPENLLNRWRYEYRKNNIDSAEKYFNKLFWSHINSFIQAEIYFDLSSIYLGKGGTNVAIKYATLGIKAHEAYPGNYINLGIGYIQKWWADIEKAVPNLQRAIELYPNNSSAYKQLWVYFYIKDDYKNAIANFEKQLEVSWQDIWLMQGEKEQMIQSALYDLARAYALSSYAEKSIFYLNQVLDGKNKVYYAGFITDFMAKNWPFDKLKTNDVFVKNLQIIMNLYKTK